MTATRFQHYRPQSQLPDECKQAPDTRLKETGTRCWKPAVLSRRASGWGTEASAALRHLLKVIAPAMLQKQAEYSVHSYGTPRRPKGTHLQSH